MIFIKYLTPEFPFDQQQGRQTEKWLQYSTHIKTALGVFVASIGTAQVQVTGFSPKSREITSALEAGKKGLGLVVNTSK